ncbi:glutamate--tRNA ligase [Candidatus Woesearchaeota archaeon]|nr:MAG: glutamate--tRNA ligase [Candidatus Woesearchaeota archaeon]
MSDQKDPATNEAITTQARKLALENAVKYHGKASFGAVIGKLLHNNPSLRENLNTIKPTVQRIIDDVNKLTSAQQQQELHRINPEFEKEQAEKKENNRAARKELPPLPEAKRGNVTTRMAPEPSKYPHIGHAMSFLINYLYAKKYEGTCILRFDDTNPEKEAQEYVDAITTDVLDYLNITPAKTVFVSDAMETYYAYADKLIKTGNAYTSTQTPQEMSADRRAMRDNPEREKPITTIQEEWNRMKAGDYPDGTITLRLKISMQHKNAVMRDPVIFRICSTPHYRQGTRYKAWPLYDFACAIQEHIQGVTHVLRSSEFDTRIELQNHIRSLLGLNNPYTKQYARFNITGALTTGREIRERIESGEYTGWDDPRLVTLRALRRRGITKEALFELATIIGMSRTPSSIGFETIATINRRILDNTAKRYFFIKKPTRITINGAPRTTITLKNHPTKDLGTRTLTVSERLLIEEADAPLLNQNKLVRLIDFCNIKNKTYHSDAYDAFKGKGTSIIHYLPDDPSQLINTTIIMPDATSITGVAERNATALNEGDIIQFIRFGFCRLDKKEPNHLTFYYAHN